ncbi:MAG: N-acetylmuramoyl-L-alanine amidase [Acidimicrobiales bacterium]
MTHRSVVMVSAIVLVASATAGAALWRSSASKRVTTTAPSSTAATTTAPATTTTVTAVRTTTTSVVVTSAAPSSSSTTAAPAARPEPRAGVAGAVVALDPGHNERNSAHTAEINRQVDVGNGTKSCDTTGTATDDGSTEAAFTTDVAARVRAVLVADGATVVMTRDASTPWGPCIDERARIGNDAHADAAVSIHADGGPATGRGFHVIEPAAVSGHNEAIVAPSHELALALRATYEQATGLPRSTYLGVEGISTRSDLGGLNLSTVPKVFIETGNMRNAVDGGLLVDGGFRQRIAEGIAAGIEAFLTR